MAAEAKATSVVMAAEAKAKALQFECDAANQYFNGNVEKYYQYKAIVDSLKNNTTVLLPHDFTTMNFLDIANISRLNTNNVASCNPQK